MLRNFSILLFLVRLVVILKARASLWAEDGVKIGSHLYSALLFIHDGVNSIDSSLCLGFMGRNASFH